MLKVYAVVRVDNTGLIGVYSTREKAQSVADNCRVPAEVLEEDVE
jgi:hypothetical protein